MSAEAGMCYRNSAYRRSRFDKYVETMSGAVIKPTSDWQGYLLADCIEAEYAAGTTRQLSNLYDPDGSWPLRESQQSTAKKIVLTPADPLANGSVSSDTETTPSGSPRVNIYTADNSSDHSIHSLARPGEIYDRLTEEDMLDVIHAAQEHLQIIALQVAKDIGWTMPSLISSRAPSLQLRDSQPQPVPVAKTTG